MKYRFCFFILLVVGVFLHAFNSGHSPIVWQDEVQICEEGRITLDPTPWRAYWMPIEGSAEHPSIMRYVAAVPQELAYRAAGRRMVRYWPIFGLMLTSVLVWLYALRRTRSEAVASVVGLLFFAYPALVQSVRGARVDVWAFFYLFLSLLLVRKKLVAFFFVGFVSALCVFSWGTAIVLMPIVLWETLDCVIDEKLRLRNAIGLYASAAAGGVMGSAILLLPVLAHVDTLLAVLSYTSKTVLPMDGRWLIKETVLHLVALPCFLAVGLVCMVLRRRAIVLFLGAMAFLMTLLLSQVYVFRALYLLPYAVISVLLFMATERHAAVKRLTIGLLTVMAVFAYGRSVVVRNAVEVFSASACNYVKLAAAFEETIGRDQSVYTQTYQPYFIGRELGWKMYRTFEIGGVVPDECLAKADWFVAEKNGGDMSGLSKDALRKLEAQHFKLVAEIPVQDLDGTSIATWIDSHRRYARLGPFAIYQREKNEH